LANYPFGMEARSPAEALPLLVGDMTHGRFASGDPSGASLSGRFVAPAAPKFVRGAVTGSDVYFVVFTLQRGAPPEIRVEGEGLTSRVTVGGQTVTFDGERIVWGRGK
jgi:hypothetical protein